MPERSFAVGDLVQRVSHRAQVGEVAAVHGPIHEEYWYSVRLQTGATIKEPQSALTAFRAATDVQGLFTSGSFGGPADLARRTTYLKLEQPLENTLYSLGGSRVEFYPHQYKPLLRFLDSEAQRLLIADEVGLGKTIEAGLILVELRARGQLRNVLVTCPAALVTKWQEEMWTRFDEEFRIYTAGEFHTLLREAPERGGLHRLRGIISLPSLRQDRVREIVAAYPPDLDLLIVDEAHHIRNSDTLTHEAVALISSGVPAALFLTATPIHLGNRDLYNLLAVLDPGRFDDLTTFNDVLHYNEPIVEAERLARIRPLPTDEILLRLDAAEGGAGRRFFANNYYLGEARRILEAPKAEAEKRGYQLERLIQRLNLLNDVVTRTRKRDVISDGAQRAPKVFPIDPTPEEEAFYEAVTCFVRDQHGGYGRSAATLAAITAQRQVASCMQAAKAHFLERARYALGAEASDLEQEWWDGRAIEDGEDLPLNTSVIRAARALGDVDTKFDTLLEVLAGLDEEEPGRKLMVFAYFKRTLAYLERRLTERGYSTVRIDGSVQSHPNDPAKDERGRAIRRFKNDPDVRILLSSEVGSEGLDFQFCHILINYDLPWNPMRVEQRIGRLDRLGQEADRILIMNLSTRGTIEHRILSRLYSRIGIFRRSLGDLEAILGDEIRELTRDLLSRHLTPEEEEERIERAARAVEARRLDLERLEQESERLVGRDLGFEQRLQRARRGGEIIDHDDLHRLFSEYMEAQHAHSRLEAAAPEGAWTLHLGPSLETALRKRVHRDPLVLRTLHRMDQRPAGSLRVTFNPQVAFADSTLELLASHHPLMALAVDYYRQFPEQLHPVASMRVEASDELSAGHYLLLLHDLTIRSGRERHRLQPYLFDDRLELLDRDTASLAFGKALRESKQTAIPEWDASDAAAVLAHAEEECLKAVATEQQEMRARQSATVQTRLATLRTTYDRRRADKRRRLRDAQETGADPRYMRLLEGTLRNMEAEHEARVTEIEMEADVSLSSELVAIALIEAS